MDISPGMKGRIKCDQLRPTPTEKDTSFESMCEIELNKNGLVVKKGKFSVHELQEGSTWL